MIVINTSKGNRVIADKVRWAGTSAERRKGLLGRTEMSANEGMYITPCEWIHTFGMKFPIDVAFPDKHGRILHVHHALKPRRLSRPVLRADGALELAAGRLRETETEVGDYIAFQIDSRRSQ
ncbi:MAG: DUF192 domain-containing protein [candidate division Zixibacteria bacterium]|nr:DUF192 domain-containing protein [candidate division Zixibacteria bacterium]